MSHLISCDRVSGGRAFFFPEDLAAMLDGGKEGKSGLTVVLKGNVPVQVKDTPTELLAKIQQAKGGHTILTIYKADPEIMRTMPPIEDAVKEVEEVV